MLENSHQTSENLSSVNLISGCALVGVGLFAHLWFIPVGVSGVVPCEFNTFQVLHNEIFKFGWPVQMGLAI